MLSEFLPRDGEQAKAIIFIGEIITDDVVKWSIHKMTHKIPEKLKTIISSSAKAKKTWDNITPLAKNEWICWITSAKKKDTRDRRARIAKENLANGKRRPCCWAGCPHR